MGPVRVAVIAASSQGRADLQTIIDAHPALAFVDSAADADALAKNLAGSVPDVLLIDNEPGAGDVLKALFELGQAPPALPGDASAILSRNAMPAEIAAAIEAVAEGLCVLSPDILARLLTGRKPLRQTSSGGPFEALTLREIEVLAMLADGLGNKEIARAASSRTSLKPPSSCSGAAQS